MIQLNRSRYRLTLSVLRLNLRHCLTFCLQRRGINLVDAGNRFFDNTVHGALLSPRSNPSITPKYAGASIPATDS